MGRTIGNIDWLILVPILILTAFSLTILGSINPELLMQQILFFIIGYVLFFVISRIDYRIVQPILLPLFILLTLFLGLSFLGPSIRGSRRWLPLVFANIQPSEVLKPFFLLVQSAYLSSWDKLRVRQFFYLLALFVIPAFIVFKQPDFGNTIIYIGTFFGLLFMSPIPVPYLISLVALGGAVLPFGWHLLHDYQRNRLLSFLNPQLDSRGTGYNVIQAMIAIGSGGIWGRGLGRGPQSHLRFLPENHTDFIFASISEELGFIGSSMLIVTYGILLFQLFLIYRKSPSSFGQYFTIGVFVQMFLQIVINVGMNIGLLPITGITLPIVSYGGSSLVAIFVSLGIVQRISRENLNRQTIAIG